MMDLMDLMKERVKILYEGLWQENQVKVEENKKYSPRITKKMREIAKIRFANRKEKNPNLFDGKVFHLDWDHSDIKPGLVFLALGPIKYSLYDIARREYAERYGWSELPTGMGTSAVIVTSDSKIVMHRRFAHVDHVTKISTIGSIYGNNSPFDHIKQEILEELAVKEEEIQKIILLGIYNRLDERVNYGLTFLIEVLLSSKEILERQKFVENKEGEVFFLEKKPEILRRYLKFNHQKILSDGFVGLVMAGRYYWERTWSRI